MYFVGNDTGMNNHQELVAQTRFGIVGIGWQLNMRGSNWSHLEEAERSTARQLKALDPTVKVLVTRNSQAGVAMLDSVRQQLLNSTSTNVFIKGQPGGAGCKTGQFPGKPSAVGQLCEAYWGCKNCGPGNGTSIPLDPFAPPGPLGNGDCAGSAWWNFTDPGFVSWWHDTLMAQVLAEPLIDGYYYDGAGRWPGIAPDNLEAFANASIAVYAKTLEDTKAAKKMAIDWGSGYINPQDCNAFLYDLTRNPWTNQTLQLTWMHGAWFEVTLATFLVGRGVYSLLDSGLHGDYMCASGPCGTQEHPGGGVAFGWPPILDADFGHPLEPGHNSTQAPDVWTRRWSKASVSVNCSDFTGKVTLDPVHKTPIPFNPAGSTLPSTRYVDWNETGAQLVASFLPGRSADIRSGNPGMRTVAFTTARIGGGTTHALSSIAFTYRYGAGYQSGRAGANFSAALCPLAGFEDVIVGPPVISECHVIYTSPVLDKYTLPDYSPAVQVVADELQVPTGVSMVFALFFDNNARNVQIGLPSAVGLNISVVWAA